MSSIFRPIILWKKRHVDLSLLTVSGILILLLIILLLSTGYIPLLQLFLVAVIGFSVGILVIIWEMYWHRYRNNRDFFHPSYLPHIVNLLFILLMYFSRSESLLISSLTAFIGYKLSLLCGFLVLEKKWDKRFTWLELFPK